MSDDNRTIVDILGPARVSRLMSEANTIDEIAAVVDRYAVAVGLPISKAFEQLIPLVRTMMLAIEVEQTTNH